VKILIPTLGRIEKQKTWDNLCSSVRQETVLVVSKEEKEQHKSKGRNTIICPVQGKGMAVLRQWMMEYSVKQGWKKVVFVDDDLVLQVRREDLRVVGVASQKQQEIIFNWVESTLDTYAHCALSERTAGFSDRQETVESTKGIQVVGYNLKMVQESGARFNKDVPDWFFIEDFHMTIQLLKKGYPNLVSRKYRHSAAPSNELGGCSKFRTSKRMKEASKILERLHPEFVKAVQKETKSAWGGGTRWNVRVQWKKAYESSNKKATSKRSG
jgi:hypothetical protein